MKQSGTGQDRTFVERSEGLAEARFQSAGDDGETGWHGETAGGQVQGRVARREEVVRKQVANGGTL